MQILSNIAQGYEDKAKDAIAGLSAIERNQWASSPCTKYLVYTLKALILSNLNQLQEGGLLSPSSAELSLVVTNILSQSQTAEEVLDIIEEIKGDNSPSNSSSGA